MILVDANIFMYAGGADHPHKTPSAAFLARVAAGTLHALIDAEVLQEILHRYRAINRWQDGRRVYDLARDIVPQIVPIAADTLDEARRLLDKHPGLTARDALHAAVCRIERCESLCSYDQGFDPIEGVRRYDPAHYL